MAAETYEIEIKGYLLDADKSGIPNHSGVYFVYECTFNKEKDTVTVNKLIYIGESDKLRDRISSHEKYDDWKKHVREGNILCYSTCRVSRVCRERVEAAYIFKHKPPENEEYTDSFPFDKTTLESSGRTTHLNKNFTVDRT